jgi:tryptophan synthase alpha chain
LAAGVTVDDVFSMMERVRKSCDVPVALMTYVNPVVRYGTERFMKNCSKAGIDAVIVPDVPFEERDELLPFCGRYGITLISMVAPTSGERIRMIAAEAEGFIYCVSSPGVTGIRETIGNEAGEMVRAIKTVKDIPCAIGFGISTPEQAAELSRLGDGIIVGSAVVKIVEQYCEDCVGHVAEYVRRMKEAISG